MKQSLPRRKANRLSGYDYASNGVYFITICTKEKQCLLSRICPPENEWEPPAVSLSSCGVVVEAALDAVPVHYPGACIDDYVIMPNHVHFLLRIEPVEGGRQVAAPTIVGGLKRAVSIRLGTSIWQKGFYDHVIRDDEDYRVRAEYIAGNPARWISGENDAR